MTSGLLFLFSLFVFICFCFIIWEVIRSDSYFRKNVFAAVWTMAQKSQRETNRGEDSMPSWSCFLWVTPDCRLHEGYTVVWFFSPLHFQGLIVSGMENTLEKYSLFWFNGSAVLWATLCKRCLHHLRPGLEEICWDSICSGLASFPPDLGSLTDMHSYSTLKEDWKFGSSSETVDPYSFITFAKQTTGHLLCALKDHHKTKPHLSKQTSKVNSRRHYIFNS